MSENRHPAGTSLGGQWAPGSAGEVDLDAFDADPSTDPGMEDHFAQQRDPMRDMRTEAHSNMLPVGRQKADRVRSVAKYAAISLSEDLNANGVDPEESKAVADMRAIADRERTGTDMNDLQDSLALAARWRANHVPDSPTSTAQESESAQWSALDPRSVDARSQAREHNTLVYGINQAVPEAREMDFDDLTLRDGSGRVLPMPPVLKQSMSDFGEESGAEGRIECVKMDVPERRFFAGPPRRF